MHYFLDLTKHARKDTISLVNCAKKEGKMKKQEPKDLVDILLATYNTNLTYLKIQIDSILNQSHRQIHLMISDDYSSDEKVREVLEEYAEKDDRITLYIQPQNLGYLKNFEFLLRQSDASYVMFCDHDDIWYEDKVKKSLGILKGRNVDLVYTDAEQIDEQGAILHKSYLSYKDMPQIEGKDDILAFSRHIAIGCSQLFTKKIKEQMLPFSEEMMAHDWLSVYLASKEKGIYCIKEPLFGYRLHNSNVFGGRNLKQNLKLWKKENGSGLKSFYAYRQKAIVDAYLKGAQMCASYSKKLGRELSKEEQNVLDYYQQIERTRCVNWHIKRYGQYLKFKGIGKRALKEVLLFHFPVLGYILFAVI